MTGGQVPAKAIEAAIAAFATHRWKSMGVASVECECGAILYGAGNLTQFPADAAFRRHLAEAALEAALPAIRAECDALIAEAVVNEGQRWQEQITRLRNALKEAASEMDHRYELGAEAEREACAQLAERQRFIHFAGMIRARRVMSDAPGVPSPDEGPDNDAADRMAAEGITGLYWDNLGHGGEV